MTENRNLSRFSPDFLKILNSKNLFIVLVLLTIAVNGLILSKDMRKTRRHREAAPFYFSGSQFSGLKQILKGVPYVGYYTDKDFSKTQNAALFAEAQYVLAPSILDLNNTNHDFVIFDCTDKDTALRKIGEINAVPLKRNPFGAILARKMK